MAIRFRKSIKVAPGVRLSVGKKSGSIRLGPKNAGVSIGTWRKSASASLPGTGLGLTSQSRGGCFGAAVIGAVAILGGSFFLAAPHTAQAQAAADPPMIGFITAIH